MKTKKRFGELNIGDSFEWCGKTIIKDGDKTARSFSPRTDYVFTSKDMVVIEHEDEDIENDSFFNVFGGIAGSSASQHEDLFDAYVREDDLTIKDKCN